MMQNALAMQAMVQGDVTPSSADRPAEQSHYLELMIGALVWRPTVRRSSWAPSARLLCAWPLASRLDRWCAQRRSTIQ